MATTSPPLMAEGRRFPLAPVLMVVVALIVAAGLAYFAYVRLLAPPAVAPISGTPVKIARGNLATTVAATGQVVATRQSRLTLQGSGRLKDLPVKLGDEVKTGAVLAKLDTAPLELRLAQAKSALKRDQIKLDQLKAGPRTEEVAQAEAAVTSAQGKLSDLQAGSLPQEIAQAQAQAENSAAMVRQAQARLDALRTGATPDVMSAAQQQLTAAQAQVDKARADLAKLTQPNADEIAALKNNVDKTQAALKLAQAAYDKLGGRSDRAALPQALALQQATLDYNNAIAQLNLKQQPRQTDVEAAQAGIDAAQAQVAAAQARIDQLNTGANADDVRAAQASVEAAQATYQQALARVDTLKAGAKPGDLQAAQASLDAARQQLALKRSPTTAQDIALAEEQVNASQLIVQQAQMDLDNATLVAPYDGVVGAVSANVGEQVTNTSPILTLTDPKAVRVDATVDETDVGRLAVGKTAQVTFDGIPGKTFAGKVIAIAPNAVVQQGLSTYTVSVGLDDTTGVTPGLTANVGVVAAEKQNVVLVPNRAIKRFGRSPSVDVLTGDKTDSRAIKTGLVNDQYTEVTDGLAEGETVVIPAMVIAPVTATGAPAAPGAPPAPAPPAAPAKK